MATQLDLLKVELARIKRDIEALEAKIKNLERQTPGEMPFAKMRGVWKGANFTEEEIDAVKIRAREFPE